MLGRLPSLTMVRLLAALLLAVIGVQAGQSFDSGLEPTHGSAFSAATYEVALASQRRGEKASTASTPLLGAPAPSMATVLALAVIAPQPAPRPDSTGPPALPILDRQPPPRAPPAA